MTARESYSDGMSWQLQGSDAISQASAAARSFAEVEWLTEDETARLCVIVEELIANLYEHAGLTHDQQVELSFAGEPDALRIVIVDPGTPFDPRLAPPRSKRLDRGGGAGIDIVRAWAEIVDYAPVEAGNRLELVFPVRQ